MHWELVFVVTKRIMGWWCVCDSSRGDLSVQALFNMSNASSDRAGTIVLGGGLERRQNLPYALVTMVTQTCGAWQADISNAQCCSVSSSAYVHKFTHF